MEHYPWKRFWCPRGTQISLADQGYLVDPEEHGHFGVNYLLRPLQSLLHIPCLILLGEPGIGKSTALSEAFSVTQTHEDISSLYFDLKSFGSEHTLERMIFGNQEIRTWKAGGNFLHLFLDSLDEGLLRVETIASLFSMELERLPAERLFLRIACRTAEWPLALEKSLKRLWCKSPTPTSEDLGVYELVPLRKKDVKLAIGYTSLDPDNVLAQIAAHDAVPFAIKPNTLRFLLNISVKSGQIPRGKAQLYKEGCLTLCTELNDSRRQTRRMGALDPPQRLVTAGRVAAATIFGNRYAIWQGNPADVPEDDVALANLAGGAEDVDGVSWQVKEEHIREILDTGLFGSYGPSQMGWAHKSYADFLAAWYIVHHDLPIPQILSLIANPEDGSIVPQLRETIVWLVNLLGLRLDVFEMVLKKDASLLLETDFGLFDDEHKRRLVAQLLADVKEDRVLPPDLGTILKSQSIAHKEIASQLVPFVAATDESRSTRELAIELAVSAGATEISPALLRIVENDTEEYRLRKHAAWALSVIGNGDSRAAMRSLALKPGEDAQDEIKGYALATAWPRHMSTEEVFTVISKPKRDSLYGGYRMFLHRLANSLSVADLPHALNWVQRQERRHDLGMALEDLLDEIMIKAWENLEDPAVLDAFVSASLSRIRKFEPILQKDHGSNSGNQFVADDQQRKIFLRAFVPCMRSEDRSSRLVWVEPRMLFPKDIPWMIEELAAAPEGEEREAWAKCLKELLSQANHDEVQPLLEQWLNYAELTQCLRDSLGAVSLNSSEAQRMREAWAEHKGDQEERDRENAFVLTPAPRERVEICLKAFEAGQILSWESLTRDLTLETNSRYYKNVFALDLTDTPVWTTADVDLRHRIINVASSFLTAHIPQPSEWLFTNIYHYVDMSGAKALCLLEKEAPGILESLPTEIWTRWVPVLLSNAIPTGGEEEKAVSKLIQRAYRKIPEPLLDLIEPALDYENALQHGPYLVHRLQDCWDDKLAQRMLDLSKKWSFSWNFKGQLLLEVLEHSYPPALQLAELLLQPTDNLHENPLAVYAAVGLLENNSKGSWGCVWPAMTANTSFGKKVVAQIAERSRLRKDKIVESLSVSEIGEAYAWLVEEYPYETDPEFDGCHAVSTREEIGRLRDLLHNALIAVGTPEATVIVDEIAVRFPQYEWMKRSVLRAEQACRIRAWMPPSPKEVLSLAQNSRRRLVRDGNELLSLLIEYLYRVQEDVRFNPRLLWNQSNDETWRPKEENDFSDFVKLLLEKHLAGKNIVLNREVHIKKGSRTDIQVDAIGDDTAKDTVRVVIEVKGCWHRELCEAMEKQLLNKYLTNVSCRHGIYLVGWFYCPQWSQSKQNSQRSIEEAEKYFNEQAVNLSKDDTKIRSFILDATLPD